MNLHAVVLDFDGLVIDSEWAIFETAMAAFAAHGHGLSVEAWATVVGTHDHTGESWWTELCAAAGVAGFERHLFDAAYEAQDRSNRDELPALPGVVELVAELVAAAVPIGIASSSSRAWLDRHLDRLDLARHFGAIVGSDAVGGVGKPAPDVYLRACADLGADPGRSVAVEDSAHGVAAAKAAGMAAVAVPSQITRFNDFGRADLVVGSVADLSLGALDALVSRAGPSASHAPYPGW